MKVKMSFNKFLYFFCKYCLMMITQTIVLYDKRSINNLLTYIMSHGM